MLVYYFVPFIVSNRYLLFWVSHGHNSVTVQIRTHVYMNFFDHKDIGNHLLQLCPKVVKQPVYNIWRPFAVEQCPSWEINRSSDNKKSNRILSKPNVHYRVHNGASAPADITTPPYLDNTTTHTTQQHSFRKLILVQKILSVFYNLTHFKQCIYKP